MPPKPLCRERRGTAAHKWVYDYVAYLGHQFDEELGKLNRECGGMPNVDAG